MPIGNIINVTPIPEYFSITWAITNRCNYDCMYCPPDFHNLKGDNHSFEQLKDYWINVYEKTSHLNLKYKISITGGEATTNTALIPFLKWLRENYSKDIAKILLTSNGSAGLNYYKELFLAVDNLTLTVHSEHIDEKKFFSKVTELNKFIKDLQKVLHVDIMNEFWNKERIPFYVKILVENQIPYSINEINYKYQTREFPIIKGNLNFE